MRQASASVFNLLPAILATLLVLSLANVWGARLTHPVDLEWMEGGMLTHAWRVQQGLPLYTAPSPEFIPFVYTPGYATLLGWLGTVTELSHALGRSLSLLGTLLSAVALAVAILRHSPNRDPWIAWSVAAIWLGCFRDVGAFFDLVRPDALHMALIAWSVVAALDRRPVVSGLLLAAAFWFKHSAATLGIPICFGLWITGGLRPALRFAFAAAVPALALTVWMQVQSGGHFLRYILLVPASHPWVPHRFFPLPLQEIGQALPVAAPVVGLWLAVRRPRVLSAAIFTGVPVALGVCAAWHAMTISEPSAASAAGHFAVGAGLSSVVLTAVDLWRAGERPDPHTVTAAVTLVMALLTAMAMRSHEGGFVNVHMPVLWLLCLVFGLVLTSWREAAPTSAVLCATGMLLAAQLGTQLVRLDTRSLMPDPRAALTARSIVQELEARQGPILSPYASWLPAQAGHRPSMHLIGLFDIDHEGGPYADAAGVIDQAIADGRYGVVVDGSRRLRRGLERHYRVERTGLDDDRALAPRTGWDVFPTRILVPR